MQLILQNIIAIILIFPFVLAILIFWAARKFNNSKQKSIGYAADGMTLVLLISVPLIMNVIFGVDSLFYIYVSLVSLAIAFIVLEWRSDKELIVLRALRKVWRIYFVILSTSYVLLMLIGLIVNAIMYSVG